MAVYRFRISFEDVEDVYREIDILGKQSYEELHRAILEAISFDNLKDASFYMSDDYWRKGQEIALKVNEEDDDEDAPRNKKPAKLMSKSKIADFIDDPHQRLLYVYDPQVKWIIQVELMRILADDPKVQYPKCTKTVGVGPKQYKVVIAPPVEDEEIEDDEEDKKRKSRAFHVVEEFDGLEHAVSEEDGDVPEGVESEAGAEVEEGSEEGGEDAPEFDPSEFGIDEDL
jgi:Plasmid pRiA4b ORF-3-like protein